MKRSTAYCLYVVVALLASAAVLYFAPDPITAAGGLLLMNAPVTIPGWDILVKAFDERNAKIEKFAEKIAGDYTELKSRVTDVEQKAAHRPAGGGESKSFGQVVVESEEFKAAAASGGKARNMQPVNVGSFFQTKATITGQPALVAPERIPGIVAPPQRRLLIRDLFRTIRVSGNLVEFARELAFNNAAAPQYDAGSPTQAEGARKPESSLQFEFAQTPVVTVAHWVPASRQVLSDAPMLQDYIDERLLYGLAFKEDDMLLHGDGNAQEYSGLIHNATAFNLANSGDTYLDTLARSIAQLAASEYGSPSGIILNPLDFWSSGIRLLKNANGDYIMGDPHTVGPYMLWGLPVVVTNSMTRGEFITLDAQAAGYIADREDANVRVAEQHEDFFIRNLVVILAEFRAALVVVRPAAIVHGRF
jgi:HK97 family phage major capsid protein